MSPNPHIGHKWSHLLKKSLVEKFILCVLVFCIKNNYLRDLMDKYIIFQQNIGIEDRVRPNTQKNKLYNKKQIPLL